MPIATNPTTGEAVYLADDGQWRPAQTAVNPDTKETLAFDGKDWTPVSAAKPAPPPKGVLGYVDDAVRSIAGGMTGGYADEIAAKADELTGRGGSYEGNLAAEKARDAQIPAAIKYPGEVAGAVAGTLAAAPIATPAAAATGITKLPAMLQALLSGGVWGALAGSGNAEPGKRLEGAGEGAAIGAGVGAAAYPLANSVAAIYRNFRRPQSQAAADLGRALRRDEMTPADLASEATRLSEVRPGVATLADAGGENVRGLVERIAQTPGAGRTQVVPALTDRQKMQAGRLSVDLETLMGSRRSAVDAVQQTMESRMRTAAPLYDEAFDFNAREVPAVVDAFRRETSTGFGQEVLRSREFRATLQTEYGIKDPLDAPLMVVIDAWKKTADDLGRSLERSGHGNAARVIGDMKNRVVSVVDEHNPAYKAARDAWAGPTQYIEALNDGRDFLRVSSDDVRQTLAGLTPSEREAYVIGALASISKRMGDDSAKLPDFTKYLRSPQMREKVAALMPTPEAAQKWADRLNFEVRSSELSARALGNSATARRLAEQDAAHELPAELVMDAFLGSPPAGLLRRFLTALPTQVRDKVRSKSDRLLADLLLNPNSVGSAELARIMSQSELSSAPPSVLRGAIPANAVNSVVEQ